MAGIDSASAATESRWTPPSRPRKRLRKHKVQSNLARNAERLERDPRLLLLPLLQPMPPRLLCFHDNEPPSINHRPCEDRFRVGRSEWNFLAASLMAPPLGFLRPPPGHFTPQNSPPRGRNGNGSERYHAKRIAAIHAARIAFRSRCVCRHFLVLIYVLTRVGDDGITSRPLIILLSNALVVSLSFVVCRGFSLKVNTWWTSPL